MAELDIPEALLEQTKAYLLQADDNGDSLYDHLADLLVSLVENKPSNALQQVESFAHNLRSDEFREEKRSYLKWTPTQADERTVHRAAESKRLFETAKSTAHSSTFSDLLEEASYFEAAGVGLAREELYQIMLSIRKLEVEKKLTRTRFFGKILGSQGNYIVVESSTKTKPLTKPVAAIGDVAPTEVGAGANKLTYFVASYAGGAWTELPDVTPQQINTARRLRRLFSGNLQAEVAGFSGNEASYLRAQIARIAAGAVIAPNNAFKVADPPADPEEGQEPEPINPHFVANEEFEEAESSDKYAELENLVHASQHVLQKQGRCDLYTPPKKVDEEGNEIEEDENSPWKEEETAPLRTIAEDTPLLAHAPPKQPLPEGEEPDEEANKPPTIASWTTRVISTVVKADAFTFVRSNRWPGAFAFVAEKGRRFANLYVGNGTKYLGSVGFTPDPPATVNVEAVEEGEVFQADPSAQLEAALLKGEELPPADAEGDAEAE